VVIKTADRLFKSFDEINQKLWWKARWGGTYLLISDTKEVEIGRIPVWGQASTNKAGMLAHICSFNCVGRTAIRVIVWGHPVQKIEGRILKTKNKNRAGGT
jgi:hypothetical protein